MKPLGRKQNISNAKWLEVVADIENRVSRTELDALAAAAAESIRTMIRGKHAAYAWSGGKDSIVLGHICENAGVTDCMIAICDLEYPAFMDWITSHRPKGCDIINTHQDLNWLAQHPNMLFPNRSEKAAHWFSIVQHRAQRQYFNDNGVEIMLLGRRKADGNYVGRGANSYTDGAGVTRYSPLADWTHEQALAYIHYHALSLPPIYGWKNGYLCGTHPWPARQWTDGNGWQEVYDIDPSIVEAAADVLPGAKAFLGGIRL